MKTLPTCQSETSRQLLQHIFTYPLHRLSRWALLIILGVLAARTMAASQPNLLVNGDFESGGGGSGMGPIGWATEVDAGSAAQTWITSSYVSSTHSVQTVMSTSGQADWRQFVSGIDPMAQYRIRAHIYATNVTAGSHAIEVQWFAGSTYLGRVTGSATAGSTWQEVKVDSLVPPRGTTSAYILLRAYLPGTYQ